MTKKKDQKSRALEQKIAELEHNWRRALADYQNLQKRLNQQQTAIVKFANASLIDKLLGILDDLDRAVKHHQNEQWLKLIRNQLHDILQSEGVSEIDALGAKFDPNTMDCIHMVEDQKNKVTAVMLKGYKYHDHVLRPAKVEVGAESSNRNPERSRRVSTK